MLWEKRILARGALLLGLLVVATGCAKPEYIGSTGKGFWSETHSPVSPNDAYTKAMPYLEDTWKARCAKVHNNDEWCAKAPLDYMVRSGGSYYVTRTSHPYTNHSEYMNYAVRVDSHSGEVTPFQ